MNSGVVMSLLSIQALYFMVMMTMGIAGGVDAVPMAPDWDPPGEPRDCGDGLSGFPCAIGNIARQIAAFFKFVYMGAQFFLDMATFNVDGAPAWIRTPISMMLGLPWVMLALNFIRGR